MRSISLANALATVLTVSAIASSPGFATPPQGLSVTSVVNGHFGELSVLPTDKTGKWSMLLKTKDDTDVGVDEITLDGGGSTGWHSHPAAVFVTVTSGSIIWYDGTNPVCPGHHYSAGQSFAESAFVIHNAVNASASSSARFIGVRMNPTGVPFVNDEGKPTNCN
jgi:quercetin dioxygenase-like cupin family protein